MIGLWLGFIGFVVLMLALDLGVFHRHAHVVRLKEALGWSAVWISLGLLFSVFIFQAYEGHWFGLGTQPDAVDGLINSGRTAAVKYLTGYVVEKSLSVDNIFVIAMIFGFFAVPALYQHRVLFWGILGALVMRGAMIGIGAALIAKFHWILYLFGAFLILTGSKMLFMHSRAEDPNQNPLVRLVRRFFPVTERFHGEHFFVRAGSAASHEGELPGDAEIDDAVVDAAKKGALLLTPLAIALIIVETTDLIFAVDSIPAIFAITADPFLVFTSNVFAILGLRSLYFALAGMLDKFRYLKTALAVVLMLVGVKMLTATWLKSILGDKFNFVLLGVILLILAAGVLFSLLANRRRAPAAAQER
ncbi:MAG TPA: TerC family protein [bacterium]|nr:TerC family protein [bacterium]HPR89482.1 TerC family protein [bacterium]